MSKVGANLSRISRRLLGREAHIFLAYASITFRPGASPPRLHAETTPFKSVPTDWAPNEYKLFIEECRLDVTHQQADKRDIRARAQIILTTAILLGGLLVASYTGKASVSLTSLIVYWFAGVAIVLAGLAAGGIISAKSEIGTVSVSALTHYDTGELQATVAEGYASTRHLGAETVSVLVTALRDCVLSLVVGAALLAIAHLTR